MRNYWKIVNQVIDESDIILLVMDGRLVDETRHPEIERKIINKKKQIIYVINKCDLVNKTTLEEKKKELNPCVFISAHERLGTTILKKLIMSLGRQEKITVGVVGYPNTGKSSVINAIAGRAKAKASSFSGYTRGIQKIRAGKLTLLDTPGVIPFEEKDQYKHAIIGAKDVSKIKEPDYAACKLIEALDGVIEAKYNVAVSDDSYDTLEQIARTLGKLRKGNVPDVDTAAKIILKDWQTGKIKI